MSHVPGLIISRLQYRNGFTALEADIDLERRGLILMQGLNLDTDTNRSNGAGKTSFAEVLKSILYNMTSRGLSGEEVVRAGSSEGFSGTVVLKNSNGIYHLEQTLGHHKHGNTFKILQEFPHETVEISSPKHTLKARKQLYQDILKLTVQQFDSHVFLSQTAGSTLITGKGPEVSRYLSSTFDCDKYDVMRARVKEAIDGLKGRADKAEIYVAKLQDVDHQLSGFHDSSYILSMEAAFADYLGFGQEQLSHLQDQRVDLSSRRVSAEKRMRVLLALEGTPPLDDLKVSLQKKQRVAAAVSNQIIELKSQQKLRASQEAARASLQQKEAAFQTLLAGMPAQLKAEGALEAFVTKTTETLPRLRDCLRQFDAWVSSSVAAPLDYDDPTVVAAHVTSLKTYEQEGERLHQASAQHDRLLASLTEPTCPTCGQDMPNRDSREHLEKEIRASAKALKQYRELQAAWKKANQFFKELDAFIQKQEGLKSILKDMREFDPTIPEEDTEATGETFKQQNDPQALKSLLVYAQNVVSQKRSLEAARQALPEQETSEEEVDLEGQLAALEEKASKLSREVEKIQSQVSSWLELQQLPQDSLADIDQELQQVAAEIAEVKNGLKESQILAGKFSNDAALLRDLFSRRSASQAALEEYKDDLKQLNWLKTLYKSLAKLKARKLHAIVQSIRDTLPAYTETMFSGEDIQFEIDDEDPESLLFWASRPHPENPNDRAWIPVRALSKGEQAGLRVSLLWTLKDIMQPEQGVDLLILDEPDDGLDPPGLAAFCSLLEKVRHQYGTVIVISQRSELQGVRFDHVWTAVKENGITTFNMP